MPPRPRDPFLLPAICLGVVTLVVAIPLCVRCMLPAEIDYNEGWNAVRQQQAWIPRALYGQPPGLSVTNYPSLSFHIVGALAWLGADVVLAGRLLSVLAIAVTGAILAQIAHRLTGSRVLAACSMFGWFAALELWTPNRIGTDDPQLLGMTLEIAAMAVFLRRPLRDRDLVLAAFLVVGGLFIKHSLIAVPIGMTCSLLGRRPWRPVAVWIGVGAAVSIVMTGLTLAYDGTFFFAHLLCPRPFAFGPALRLGLSYAVLSSPALAVAGWWAWRERGSPAARPLIFAWLASLAEIAAFAGGDGVGKSIFQDAMMLTALVQPIALQRIATRGHGMAAAGRHWNAAAIAPCLLLLSPLALAAQTGQVWAQVAASERQAGDVDRAVAILRAARGPVVCEDLLLCFRAGRPSSFDAYHVLDQLALGRMAAGRVDDLAKYRRLAVVQIGTADDPYAAGDLPARFSPSFMAALRANYRPLFSARTFSVYVPRGPERSAAER